LRAHGTASRLHGIERLVYKHILKYRAHYPSVLLEPCRRYIELLQRTTECRNANAPNTNKISII
jgi:hypothetical protein